VGGEPLRPDFADTITPRQREVMERLAAWIVRKRLTTPAILFLESVRPLNFVGSQVMVILNPAVQAVFTLPEWDEVRQVFERRESIGWLLDLLEKEEGDQLAIEAAQRAEKRAKRKEERAKS